MELGSKAFGEETVGRSKRWVARSDELMFTVTVPGTATREPSGETEGAASAVASEA